MTDISLARQFMNEPEYWSFSQEQFKSWIKHHVQKDTTICWNEFECLPIDNPEIFDTLFKLGMDGCFLFIEVTRMLDRLERYIADITCTIDKHTLTKMYKKYEELYKVCINNITEENKQQALRWKTSINAFD